MIVTCIPMARDQVIIQPVIEAYLAQSMSSVLHIVYNPEPYVGMDNIKKRLHNCCLARNVCLDVFKPYLHSDKYDGFLILDSDCVFLDTISVELMHSYLKCNPDFAAIALNKDLEGYTVQLEQAHIACGAVMLSREFFKLGLSYRYADGGLCECSNLAADIRACGKRIGYVDTNRRLQDLHSAHCALQVVV